MKTKTLVLTAALTAAGIATSMAQVYSVNAVGYVNQTMPNNFSLVANPFKNATNTLNALLDPNLLPGGGVGVSVYRYDEATGNFRISTVDSFSPVWLGDDGLPNGDTESIVFGNGVFMLNQTGAPFNVTWVGEVEQGTPIQNSFPAGLSVKSSKVPQAGKIQSELGFPALPDDVVYKWDVGIQNFKLFTQDSFGSGQPSDWLNDLGEPNNEPSLAIGESVFILNPQAGARNWTRNFTVN